jgi:hypothetical protein
LYQLNVHIKTFRTWYTKLHRDNFMSLRFRQTFALFPGVRLNIWAWSSARNSQGAGATVNVGKDSERPWDYRVQAYLILLPCPMMIGTQLLIH